MGEKKRSEGWFAQKWRLVYIEECAEGIKGTLNLTTKNKKKSVYFR